MNDYLIVSLLLNVALGVILVEEKRLSAAVAAVKTDVLAAYQDVVVKLSAHITDLKAAANAVDKAL